MMELRKTQITSVGDAECAQNIGTNIGNTVLPYADAFLAFTFAPNPKRYPTMDPSGQYKTLLNCIFLKKCITEIFDKFLFTPELTENGNIHIHGYYHVSDHIKYNRWFLPACKSLGYVCVKTKVDRKWIIEYVTKDMNKMEDILEIGLPVPLSHVNHGDYHSKREIRFEANRYKINITKKPKNVDIRKYL